MALNIKVGSYLGTGVAQSITGLGFAMNSGSNTFLLIKGGANIAQVTTSEMGANKTQNITGSTPGAGEVTSLDAGGFTVGTLGGVNTLATTYHYLAIYDSAGTSFKTGTYAGNATGPRSITAPGFSVDWVGIWDDLGDTGGYRTSDMATDSYLPYGASAQLTDRILSLDATGFTVSFRNEVNGTGRNYYWAAFDTTANAFKPITYTGNGTDSRDITGMGFSPDCVWDKDTTTDAMAIRFSTESGDNAFLMTATGEATDIIQNFGSDGFQVGTSGNTNGNTKVYYSIGFKNSVAAGSATTHRLTTLGAGS